MRAMHAGEYAPIYMLCGEEPYYIDRVYQYIAQNALDEMAREFDQQVVYGRDLQGADIGPIISAARGFAMMGGKKVVMVREAQAVKKWDALSAYLDVPMPDTILVICYNRTNVRPCGRRWNSTRRVCGCRATSCATTK